jgi:transposase-like protein
MAARPNKYPDELTQRGVRLVFESGRPIAQVAADLGVHPEALRKRVTKRLREPVEKRLPGILKRLPAVSDGRGGRRWLCPFWGL